MGATLSTAKLLSVDSGPIGSGAKIPLVMLILVAAVCADGALLRPEGDEYRVTWETAGSGSQLLLMAGAASQGVDLAFGSFFTLASFAGMSSVTNSPISCTALWRKRQCFRRDDAAHEGIATGST